MEKNSAISGTREGDFCDELNKTIKVLIVSNEKFLVFLDEDYYVEWVEHAECERSDNYNSVMNQMSYLESISATHFAGTPQENTDFREFRRLLGESIACLYNLDGKAAEQILAQAEMLLKQRSVERARMWYISAAGLTCIPGFLILLLGWLARDEVRQVIGRNAFEVCLCACLGGIGSLIFVIIRVREVNLNASSGPIVHYFEGIAKVAVGYVGGFLVALAVKGNILLGDLNQISDGSARLATILCIAMAAGASERMVPNLIRRVEVSSGEDSKK